MNQTLRTLWNYVVDIFWIYLRFMVLAVVIFFLVQWYIQNYDAVDDETIKKNLDKIGAGDAQESLKSGKSELWRCCEI